MLEAVENVALRVDLAGGREISASQLCERLGFDYEGQQKMIRDLSGGEKRRLQLTRLLMASPNVLLRHLVTTSQGRNIYFRII